MYDPINLNKCALEIDSQAINCLELLEVQGLTKTQKEGSLFHYLDYTRSAFGRRLLKKWISTPLQNIEQINERLDAVEDLMKHPDLV